MSASEIEALGYLGLEVSSLSDWRSFAADILGLQPVDEADGSLVLRMDQYAARIHLISGARDDLAFAGWEVADEAALERLTERLRAAAIDVERGSDELARARHVRALIRFQDPEGTLHEAYYGPLQRTDQPFISPAGTHFKTGRQGLGHVVLSCRDKSAMLDFFMNVLGFRLSDHINTEVVKGRPLEISFLRCNGRHHSLALAPVPIPKKIVHLMVEATSIDDVGRALYRCMERGIHLTFTLGRHSNDEMLSFYPLSPSRFDIEYGWGGARGCGRLLARPYTHTTNSAWGHHYQRPPKPVPSN